MTAKTKTRMEGAAMFCATNALLLAVSLSCLMVAAPSASVAQEVLPFPPKPSGSIANRTIQIPSVGRPMRSERQHLRLGIDEARQALRAAIPKSRSTEGVDRDVQRPI
jgi:hypothetical protein